MSELLLVTEDVSRRFGGLLATDGVSIGLWRGQVHALLGPNGAGKSTLINLLSGDLACSAGRVLYCGQDVTALTPDARSRIGIGRSYQKTNIFPSFTVRENCRLAAQSREPRARHVLSNAMTWPGYTNKVEKALADVGLTARAGERASALSHGEQRQLELAVVLCTGPDVLLLDEPLAGMGVAEAERMVTLLLSLKKEHGILLVEHDMDAVFTLADKLTVMVDGKVIASGTPAQIRADAGVQAAYLGEEH